MLETATEDFVDVDAFFCIYMPGLSQALSAATLQWRYGTHDSGEPVCHFLPEAYYFVQNVILIWPLLVDAWAEPARTSDVETT